MMTNKEKERQHPNLFNDDGSHRRLVLFIGPRKAASTTIQHFLKFHAHQDSNDWVPAFENWSDVRFRLPKAIRFTIPDMKPKNKSEQLRKVLQSQPSSKNVVMAGERILFDNAPSYKTFAEWINVGTPEVVLNSRSPRVSFLQSMWKQLSGMKPQWKYYEWPFRKFVCSKTTTKLLTDKLGGDLNPVGIAYRMVHDYNLPTNIMVMAGIAERGMDLAQTFACTILKVNCTEGNWVVGLNNTSERANSRHRDAGITEKQTRLMEEIFHQRDCAYGEDLYNHHLFRIHYPHNQTWPQDCGTVRAEPVYRKNPGKMLERLRQIMNCPRYQGVKSKESEGVLTTTEGPREAQPDGDMKGDDNFPIPPSSNDGTDRDEDEPSTFQNNDTSVSQNFMEIPSKVEVKDVAHAQMVVPLEVIVYVILAAIALFFARRRRFVEDFR
eukprot:scaffold7759_cov62-Cylindrotheca_fusiformis.AAC.5